MIYAAYEELQTSRLHLRRITMADAQAYYERLGSSEEVTKYMCFQPHGDISDSVAGIEKHLRRYETGRNYRWVIALQETGALIGVIDLLAFREDMLGQDFWGKGYGTEALKAVMDYAFLKMEMERIEADHFDANGGSGTVMRKVGMTYQGTIPGKYEKNGIVYDAPQYAITREEWYAGNAKNKGNCQETVGLADSTDCRFTCS